MKHLNIYLVAILFLVGVGVSNAQDQDNPWSIELAVNAVDFFPTGADSGRFNEFDADGNQQVGDIFQEYFNVNDHWNMVPSVSELKIGRYLGNGLTFVAVGSLNSIH